MGEGRPLKALARFGLASPAHLSSAQRLPLQTWAASASCPWKWPAWPSPPGLGMDQTVPPGGPVLGLALESPVDPGAPARDPRPRAFLGAMEPVWASCFSRGSLCSDSCHGPRHTQTGWMGGVPNPSVSPWVNSP